MPSVLAPVIAFYDYALQPVPALAWLGVPVSALDVAGAVRLAVVLRQQRELYHGQHVAKMAAANKKSGGKAQRAAAAIDPPEPRSRVRDFIATLVIVHGGEAIAAPWLGLRPSFFLSSTGPTIYLGAQVLVDLLPTIPSPSLFTEMPLTITHALFRMILLCNVIPRVVTGHVSPDVAASSYTLLLTAVIMPHGGPFLANLFSLLRPTPMEVTTPPELLPFGWTATDLWATPLVAGLYATLTHAQPFFTHLHALLFAFFSPFGLATLSDLSSKQGGSPNQSVVAPVDTKAARAVCAVVLCALYVNRAMRLYGPEFGETTTWIAGALSMGEALPTPSTVEEEKIDKSPEEETVETKRRGRVESLTSRGQSDDSMKFQADHNRRWAQGGQSDTSPPTTPCLSYSRSFTASQTNASIDLCYVDLVLPEAGQTSQQSCQGCEGCQCCGYCNTCFARLGSAVDFPVPDSSDKFKIIASFVLRLC
ncbi:hypothetical protein BJV78DRAFT_130524 [Lactifluus subvellereus]|nr:hypothetical protein BJV78DRAFT_130524 [Lactifluus subvellereus]